MKYIINTDHQHYVFQEKAVMFTLLQSWLSGPRQ